MAYRYISAVYTMNDPNQTTWDKIEAQSEGGRGAGLSRTDDRIGREGLAGWENRKGRGESGTSGKIEPTSDLYTEEWSVLEPIRDQILVAASQEIVWWAWTYTDRVTAFFAPAANIEARLGGAYELFFDPANRERMCTAGCTITQLEPMSRLGFSWKGPDQFAALMNDQAHLTTVTITLESVDGATRVAMEHAGWGDGEEWAAARTWHVKAWEMVLQSMKKAIESGEGEICCAPDPSAS